MSGKVVCVFPSVRIEAFPDEEDSNGSKMSLRSILQPHLQCNKLSELSFIKINLSHLSDFSLFSDIVSLKKLHLQHAGLKQLDPSIGALHQIQELSLEGNSLGALPHTIKWCCSLEVLDLRENKFSFLPGVLLRMDNLKVVKRFGNSLTSGISSCQTESGCKEIPPVKSSKYNPLSLQFCSTKTVAKCGLNHWRAKQHVAIQLRYRMSEWYKDLRLCDWCFTAKNTCQGGTEVVGIMSYCWGNCCIPFRFFACSKKCCEQLSNNLKKLSDKASQSVEEAVLSRETTEVEVEQNEKLLPAIQHNNDTKMTKKGKLRRRKAFGRCKVM
eukprot:m.62875 g.62875  ORF g.62875 m.62875 type:complete len:326 (+) comp35121_c0_seq1:70-1047(+)